MIDNKIDLLNLLKNMTLEEFIMLISNKQLTENNINSNKTESINLQSKVLYTTDELIENYPFFTRYNITKSIEKDRLPYCIIGNKRMFSKDEIEKWLEKKLSPKKVKFEI